MTDPDCRSNRRAARLALAGAASLLLLGAAACGNREAVGDGTGGATSENASVDASDPTQTISPAAAAAAAGEQPQTAGEMAGTAAGSAGQGAVSDPASTGVAVDSTPRARGVENVGGVQPGTGGVDSSAGEGPPRP